MILAGVSPQIYASVGGQTLQKNLSPRAESVGMAYTPLVDDVYAIYWNPAALSYLKGVRNQRGLFIGLVG